MIVLAGEPSVVPGAEHACAFGVSKPPVFGLTLALTVKLSVAPEWLVLLLGLNVALAGKCSLKGHI